MQIKISEPPRCAYTRLRAVALLVLAGSLSSAPECTAGAQTASVPAANATTLMLGPDQIGVVKTALRISTRISFSEPIKEIICGDLYDPATGVGGFVVQRLDNDVYLKPVASKALSNLFVKTADPEGRTYTFSIISVAPEQAHFIVNIIPAGGPERTVVKARTAPAVRVPVLTMLDLSSVVGKDVNAGLADPQPFPHTLLAVAAPPPPAVATPMPPDEDPVGEENTIPLGSPIKQVAPYYPERAKIARASGEVIVLIGVNAKGKVVSARALSGHPSLQEAALAAARGWRFSPLKEGEGSALRVGTISFDFTQAAEEVDHGKQLRSLPRSSPMVIQMKRGG